MERGARFERTELSTDRHRLAARRHPVRQRLFRPAGGTGDTASSRTDIYARVDWRWAQARPNRGRARLAAGEAASFRYDWIAYNEAMLLYILALGAPDACARAGELGRLGARRCPSVGERTDGQELVRYPADVRPPVQPRLGRFPRHPRRLHAGEGHRLFREQPPRDARPARLCDWPIRWAGAATGRDLWGLTACDGPADVTLELDGRSADLPLLCGARPGRFRRRHGRADRGGRLGRLRAGNRASRR